METSGKLQKLNEEIALTQNVIANPKVSAALLPSYRAILANLEKERDALLAQAAKPVTAPPPKVLPEQPIKLQRPQGGKQFGHAAPAASHPQDAPISEYQVEATPLDEAMQEKVQNYLLNRDKKGGAGEQTEATAVTFVPQKKTAVHRFATATATTAKMADTGERADRVGVLYVESPLEYVPSYKFVTFKGKEQLLKPGEIRRRFKARMWELAELQKPLTYSKQLPLAAAYYAALCDYEGKVLKLSYFRFSAPPKQVVFEKITSLAQSVSIKRASA